MLRSYTITLFFRSKTCRPNSPAVDKSVCVWSSTHKVCLNSMLLTRPKRIVTSQCWLVEFICENGQHAYTSQRNEAQYKSITIYLLRIYLLSLWQCVSWYGRCTPAVLYNSQTYSPKVIVFLENSIWCLLPNTNTNTSTLKVSNAFILMAYAVGYVLQINK